MPQTEGEEMTDQIILDFNDDHKLSDAIEKLDGKTIIKIIRFNFYGIK